MADTNNAPDHSSPSVTDEVAAATEELRAAQAKLDAVKAKAEQAQAPDPNWVPYAPAQSYGAYETVPVPAQQVPPSSPYPIPPQQPSYTANTQQQYYTTYPNMPPQPPLQTPPQPTYYYQQPYPAAPVVSPKDHVAAGLLGIFLGGFGIHKFYLGYNTAGFIMLASAIVGGAITFGIAWAVVWLIGFIEGIMYLVKSQSEFEYLYVFNKREWF
ncbi:MAG: TM2 domain-containing protein [Eggerthellaceae bacterium]|nr:TM2 domain-containing protein [Eggerthellaceae bacterium]